LTATNITTVCAAVTSVLKSILRRVQCTLPRRFLRPEVSTRSPTVAMVSLLTFCDAR
jgi:hypothetical protein